MLIKQNECDVPRFHAICVALGTEELLGPLTEECGELVQATQKVRRALKGTTPVSLDEALVHLAEECADVALCIDTLAAMKLVDETGVQNIGRYKTNRWYGRLLGDGEGA